MSDTTEVTHADDAPANEVPKDPTKTYRSFTTHIGPNDRGLHDAAVHAHKLPTDSDEGRETNSAPASPVITRGA